MSLFEKKYKYRPTGELDESEELIEVGKQLSVLGYMDPILISRYYTINYHYSVKKFQRANYLSANGILSETLQHTIYTRYQEHIAKYGDEVDSSVSAGEHGNANAEPFASEENQYIEESFFSTKKDSTLRRNGYNIVVQIGDYDQYVKAITGVRLRSKTIQFDASGQAIAETYEFIAKDLKENTEPTDDITK